VELDEAECWHRLGAARHGVLGTVHPDRGVDAVPVVFVVHGRRLLLPVDTVKPKRSGRLQRLRNLAADPRAVLLVDRYDDDWSRLWWVRVHGRALSVDPTPDQVAALGDAFAAYRAPGALAGLIVLTPAALRGWAAHP
jgi:PPOX class probable F420-dependent enzyme